MYSTKKKLMLSEILLNNIVLCYEEKQYIKAQVKDIQNEQKFFDTSIEVNENSKGGTILNATCNCDHTGFFYCEHILATLKFYEKMESEIIRIEEYKQKLLQKSKDELVVSLLKLLKQSTLDTANKSTKNDEKTSIFKFIKRHDQVLEESKGASLNTYLAIEKNKEEQETVSAEVLQNLLPVENIEQIEKRKSLSKNGNNQKGEPIIDERREQEMKNHYLNLSNISKGLNKILKEFNKGETIQKTKPGCDEDDCYCSCHRGWGRYTETCYQCKEQKRFVTRYKWNIIDVYIKRTIQSAFNFAKDKQLLNALNILLELTNAFVMEHYNFFEKKRNFVLFHSKFDNSYDDMYKTQGRKRVCEEEIKVLKALNFSLTKLLLSFNIPEFLKDKLKRYLRDWEVSNSTNKRIFITTKNCCKNNIIMDKILKGEIQSVEDFKKIGNYAKLKNEQAETPSIHITKYRLKKILRIETLTILEKLKRVEAFADYIGSEFLNDFCALFFDRNDEVIKKINKYTQNIRNDQLTLERRVGNNKEIKKNEIRGKLLNIVVKLFVLIFSAFEDFKNDKGKREEEEVKKKKEKIFQFLEKIIRVFPSLKNPYDSKTKKLINLKRKKKKKKKIPKKKVLSKIEEGLNSIFGENISVPADFWEPVVPINRNNRSSSNRIIIDDTSSNTNNDDNLRTNTTVNAQGQTVIEILDSDDEEDDNDNNRNNNSSNQNSSNDTSNLFHSVFSFGKDSDSDSDEEEEDDEEEDDDDEDDEDETDSDDDEEDDDDDVDMQRNSSSESESSDSESSSDSDDDSDSDDPFDGFGYEQRGGARTSGMIVSYVGTAGMRKRKRRIPKDLNHSTTEIKKEKTNFNSSLESECLHFFDKNLKNFNPQKMIASSPTYFGTETGIETSKKERIKPLFNLLLVTFELFCKSKTWTVPKFAPPFFEDKQNEETQKRTKLFAKILSLLLKLFYFLEFPSTTNTNTTGSTDFNIKFQSFLQTQILVYLKEGNLGMNAIYSLLFQDSKKGGKKKKKRNRSSSSSSSNSSNSTKDDDEDEEEWYEVVHWPYKKLLSDTNSNFGNFLYSLYMKSNVYPILKKAIEEEKNFKILPVFKELQSLGIIKTKKDKKFESKFVFDVIFYFSPMKLNVFTVLPKKETTVRSSVSVNSSFIDKVNSEKLESYWENRNRLDVLHEFEMLANQIEQGSDLSNIWEKRELQFYLYLFIFEVSGKYKFRNSARRLMNGGYYHSSSEYEQLNTIKSKISKWLVQNSKMIDSTNKNNLKFSQLIKFMMNQFETEAKTNKGNLDYSYFTNIVNLFSSDSGSSKSSSGSGPGPKIAEIKFPKDFDSFIVLEKGKKIVDKKKQEFSSLQKKESSEFRKFIEFLQTLKTIGLKQIGITLELQRNPKLNANEKKKLTAQYSKLVIFTMNVWRDMIVLEPSSLEFTKFVNYFSKRIVKFWDTNGTFTNFVRLISEEEKKEKKDNLRTRRFQYGSMKETEFLTERIKIYVYASCRLPQSSFISRIIDNCFNDNSDNFIVLLEIINAFKKNNANLSTIRNKYAPILINKAKSISHELISPNEFEVFRGLYLLGCKLQTNQLIEDLNNKISKHTQYRNYIRTTIPWINFLKPLFEEYRSKKEFQDTMETFYAFTKMYAQWRIKLKTELDTLIAKFTPKRLPVIQLRNIGIRNAINTSRNEKQKKDDDEDDDEVEFVAENRTNDSYRCCITQEEMTNPVRSTICGHRFSHEGIYSVLEGNESVDCPYIGCKHKITKYCLISDNDFRIEVLKFLEKEKKRIEKQNQNIIVL